MLKTPKLLRGSVRCWGLVRLAMRHLSGWLVRPAKNHCLGLEIWPNPKRTSVTGMCVLLSKNNHWLGLEIWPNPKRTSATGMCVLRWSAKNNHSLGLEIWPNPKRTSMTSMYVLLCPACPASPPARPGKVSSARSAVFYSRPCFATHRHCNLRRQKEK